MEPILPVSAKPLSNQIFIDGDGELWTGRKGKYYNISTGGGFDPLLYYNKADSDARFVTLHTDQLLASGNKQWIGRHHFDGSLAIPSAAPVSPESGKVYMWSGPGVSAGDPSGYELPIASSAQLGGIKIGTGMHIAEDGTVSVSVVSPSNLSIGSRTEEAMAILNSNGTGVMLPIATTGQAGLMSSAHLTKLNSLGLYTGTNGIEINSSTRVISPAYGSAANTIAQGNDSRILNGQTAFGWGNHAGLYVPLSRVISTSGHLTGGGQLNSNLTLTFRPLMDNYIVDTGSNSRIRFGSIAGNDDFQMRLAHATGAFVFRNGSNQVVAQIRYDGRPTFASMAGSGNRIGIVDASGNFTAPVAISHNGSITASEITGTNRVRIPTSRPASPMPGDIWIQ